MKFSLLHLLKHEVLRRTGKEMDKNAHSWRCELVSVQSELDFGYWILDMDDGYVLCWFQVKR